MPTLTITAKGQITLKREVLRHLDVRPGDRVEVELLPHGRAVVHRFAPAGSVDEFIGMFAGTVGEPVSLEEIGQAASRGWAGGHA